MVAQKSIRGAGTDRAGATDTTMLIWKVIHANPGITCGEIFGKVEHEIPAGWAKRRYWAKLRGAPEAVSRLGASGAEDLDAARARRYVFLECLRKMRENRSIGRDESGGYRTLREIKNYRGNAAAIDETGTVAADHLNDAYALRAAEAWVARGSSRMTTAEREAVVRVIRAFRRST